MDTAAEPKEEKQKEDTKSLSDQAKWYILHTYAGHENKVERC